MAIFVVRCGVQPVCPGGERACHPILLSGSWTGSLCCAANFVLTPCIVVLPAGFHPRHSPAMSIPQLRLVSAAAPAQDASFAQVCVTFAPVLQLYR